MQEENFKRWLAVLIAGITVLIALVTLLQNQASSQAAVFTRRSQEAAIRATGAQARGQQRVTFDRYDVVAFGDELFSYAIRNGSTTNDSIGQAYIQARAALAPLSPLLQPEYSQFDASGQRTSTRLGQYEAETYVVNTRLFDEQRNAYARASSGWNTKADAYVAMLAILAVGLFLFALASTLGGVVRTMFVVVGLGLGTLVGIWLLVNWLTPVHETPDAALRQVSEGSGYTAEAVNYQVGTNAEYQRNANSALQKAIDAYSAALELDPVYANAYNLRGIARLLIQPQQAAQAAADFENALANGKREYGTYWNLATSRYYNGEFSAAVAASRAALEFDAGVCGPHFSAALASLAMGSVEDATTEYEAAISRCDVIYQDAVNHNDRPPVSLWTHMQGAVDEVDKFLCATAQRYCQPDRTLPTLSGATLTQTVEPAERLRKRLKEALTALEFQGTTQVTPRGAVWTPLQFGYYIVDPNDRTRFLNYAEKEMFPYDVYVPDIDAFSDYAGMSSEDFVVWKVYRDGTDELGLRYAAKWNLEANGPVVRRINSWYVLNPGKYSVEVYVNGELVSDGAFEVSPQPTLVNPMPPDAVPLGSMPVGELLFGENFDNNHANWLTGSSAVAQEGEVDGALSLVTHTANSAFTSGCTPCGPFSDFYFQVDATLTSGPQDFGYGLTYRAEPNLDSFYAFVISGNGHYSVSRYGDAATTLIPWTSSAVIRSGETNVLGVLCRATFCEFYINGELVNSVDDATLTGQFLGVRVDNTDVQASFDNLRVWSVE